MGVGAAVGAWNQAGFEHFVEVTLLPRLPAGSVLILDNARIHHGANLQAKVEAAGCALLYLPPYSPDFSPIELVWSWLKEKARKGAPRTDEHRQQHILQAVQDLPPQAAPGCFQHCGIL